MSEQRASFANLNFEYELAGIPTPPKVLTFARDWKHILRLLPGHHTADCLDFGETTELPLTPWGVTQNVTYDDAPDVENVKRANSKLYSHYLEQRLGVALPYSRIIESATELTKVIDECPYDWVLKHPFGVSGRERMVGRRGIISESARGWAKKRLNQGWNLVFEPWVEKIDECSFHFQLETDGQVRGVGQTQLLTASAGVHCGNRVGLPIAGPEHLESVAREAAEHVANLGYRGPLGVDSFLGKLGEKSVLRPIVELNARYSFGRLALVLRNWIPDNFVYTWLLASDENVEHYLGDRPTKEGLYRLPRCADPEALLSSVVIVAKTAERLLELEGAIFTPLT